LPDLQPLNIPCRLAWYVAALVRVDITVTIINLTHFESGDFIIENSERLAADDGCFLLSLKPFLHISSRLLADLN
jgi:hypothetical protein